MPRRRQETLQKTAENKNNRREAYLNTLREQSAREQ